MAEHADGSIIVDTEIDAQGFKAGSAELQKAIKSLNTKTQSLGPTFQKALSGNSSAIATFDAKASALENTISDIEVKMESLGGKGVPTEDYQWLTNELQKAENELTKLEDKQAKMEDTDVKQSSQSWKNLQYDIDVARRKIAEYKAEMANMRADGTAFQTGANTAEYSQLEYALTSARNSLAEMRTQADVASGSTSRLAIAGNAVKSAFSRIGTIGRRAFSSCARLIRNTTSDLKNFRKQSNGAIGAVSKLGKKISGLGSMLKRLALRRIFMSMLNAVKEGFNNLASYSSSANANLSTLKSALTRLKNSFASAFAPILTIVTPILATLINYLSAALTYIGKFVAALTGAKTFTKATAVQEDYAASLSNTASAAKEEKRWVAGFDELNVRNDTSTDSSSSGGGSASPSEMFEEVPIESYITDFTDRIKEAFKNNDYAGIGVIIGNGINTAVQKINDFISWDKVGEKITSKMKATAQCFNSLVDAIDWELMGDTVAQGFNTVINTSYLAITEFDWPALSAALAKSFNGIVSGINWSKLGTTASTGMRTLLASLRSAISTFDWYALGKGIAEGINSVDWVGLLGDLAGLVSDVLIATLDLLIGLADNLDWDKLGRDLWDSLIAIVTNIDWSGLVSKAFHLLGSVIGGCGALIAGICKSIWDSLKSGFRGTKGYFDSYIEEAGGNIIAGLWNGIVDALKNVGAWIVENIWDPFIEGFKSAFGIHSPSTKMAEMGGYIVQGLLDGITGAWDSITDFVGTTFESIKTTISETWKSVKTKTSTAWESIKSKLSSKWESLKTSASSTWSNLKTTISNGWSSVKSGTSTAWSSIKSSLSTTWGDMKTSASNTWSNLKTTVSNGWNNAKSNTSTAWSSIKSSLSTTWGDMKTSASNTWSNLKTIVSDGWTNVKSDTSSTWDDIKGSLSSKWGDIESTASTKWDDIKGSITSKDWSGVGSDICSGIGAGIDSGWEWLKRKVSSVASSMLECAKSVLGIHSPSKLFRDVVGLNIGYGIGEGIEASENSVVKTVAGLADAIAAEANSNNYNISGVVSTSEVDGVLTSFSDKVADSFSNLLERLQTIADGVTFATPVIAMGGIVPYRVAANTIAASSSNNSETFTEFSSDVDERLADLSYQLKQILTVVETLNLNIDVDALTSAITQQQRTKLRNYGGV